MKGFEPFGKSFITAFWVIWVISAVLGLFGTGCLVYILYRLATHPW